MTDHPLLGAWKAEPSPSSEASWTPDGEGWSAWNQHSPEVEFAEFAAVLVRLLRPALIIETGVGQGYTTRRLLAALGEGQRYVGYESDDRLRAALAALDAWGDRAVLADGSEPQPEDMRGCELAVLDSAPTRRRIREIDRWYDHAPAGSYALVHDVRGDHPRNRHHGVHRTLARHAAGLGGVLLGNPRGGWLCRRP